MTNRKPWMPCLLAAGLLVGCKTAPPPAPTMSMEEMSAMMVELGTPGDGHARLESVIGTFDAKTKMWMEPGAPPMESEGVAVNEWVLGKRFVRLYAAVKQQEFEEFMRVISPWERQHLLLNV